MREIVWSTYGETLVDPTALAAVIVLAGVLLVVDRARAILPIALVACLIPVAQRIVIASLDFNFLRILILVGWARILMRGEQRGFQFNGIDKAFVVWVTIGTLAQFLRELEFGTLIYRLGLAFDAAGGYFMIRLLLPGPVEVERAIRYLAIVAVIVATFMLIENQTGRNVFAIFGGVHEITAVRDGRLRCMGAFSHPIMAGSFGAMLTPLFIGVALASAQKRWLMALAAVASLVIVVTSASSGPLMAAAGGLVAWGLWPARGYMREFRWGLAITLTVIHFVREMPVWHLIHRVGTIVGGTGYHRYLLIDAFIKNTGDWFLLGTDRTAHWGWGLQDTTNQFVYEGVTGGIGALASFVAILVRLYAGIGKYFRAVSDPRVFSPDVRRRLTFVAWGLGAGLTTHLASFISVAYFGQLQVLLYLHFAMIAALVSATERVQSRVPEHGPALPAGAPA